MAQKIQHQLFFAHPPKAVWEYLTNPDLIQLWLMKSNFKPVVGHEFQFTAGCNEGLNFNGIIKCRVLEVSPFNKLSYSWECSSMENKVNIDSVVNWTLTSKENGTMLLLEHNGFKVLDNLPLFNAMEKGWVQHIGTMANNLNESVHANTNA